MFIYALVSGKPHTPIYAFNSERFQRFCHGMRYICGMRGLRRKYQLAGTNSGA